jgi:hypothetical protein
MGRDDGRAGKADKRKLPRTMNFRVSNFGVLGLCLLRVYSRLYTTFCCCCFLCFFLVSCFGTDMYL